jgi:DNA-binding MarR family transcriptional regulator
MVMFLAQHGATGYAALARAIGANAATLAFHIAKLEDAGIIRAERGNQRTTFELTPKGRSMLAAERAAIDNVMSAELAG